MLHWMDRMREHLTFKFVAVFIITLAYAIYAMVRYGAHDGLLVGLLTWLFFVFCTPIADAGLLIDFPLRIFTGLRMIYSEIVVWIIAATLNIIMFLTNPAIYKKTVILDLFYHILSTLSLLGHHRALRARHISLALCR
jgi:uncharacterized YccA/Bax inhibitor family protein